MSDVVIRVENLSKQYRLGTIGHGTLYRDLQSGWAKFRRIEDPNAQIGSADREQVNRTHDRFWALRDVSFDVRQGEVVGIIGRNGAGKSTLLKIISRVTAPTEGTIKIRGRVASLLEVGTGFHPELSGRENIFLNGAILGMRTVEIEQKFDEIVRFAEIDRFIDTPVKRYSSGMYVRLAFAVAAHLEPEILLVDEVLAVGDAAFQKKCLGKMGEVAKEGRTVLFVSHNMAAVRGICSRAILIDAGRIVKSGDAHEVISYYLQNSLRITSRTDLQQIIASIPPDPVFRLRDIRILQNGEPAGEVIGNGQPLEIVVHYQVLEKTTGLRVYFDLCDTDDTILFRSFHDEQGEGIPVMEPGEYISKAVIPANVLGPIRYELRIAATLFNRRSLQPTGGIRVPVSVENIGDYNRAYAQDTFRGKLAFVIPWTTQKI